jgi:hypothetical protein
VSTPKPNCASLVAGTGRFRLAGSSGKDCASEGPSGSMTAAVEPVAEKIPRNGAGMPPNTSHGVLFRRFASDSLPCSGDTGTEGTPARHSRLGIRSAQSQPRRLKIAKRVPLVTSMSVIAKG